jgi:phage shock protein A
MDVSELTNLDFEGARGMMLAFATDAKRIEKEVAALRGEESQWASRVKLAQGRGMAELAAAAAARQAELSGKIQALEAERSSILRDLELLRESLPGIAAKERRIDPELLLAQMQMMTGELLHPEAAAAESELRTLESRAGVEDALAGLKRKMGGEGAKAEAGPEKPS